MIFATYFHFLLWVQFGFLARWKEAGAASGTAQAALAAMGIAGVVGSLAAGRSPRRGIAAGGGGAMVRRRAAFGAALAATLLSALAGAEWGRLPAGRAWMIVTAALLGATAGRLTVGVATGLVDLPRARRAVAVGLGTGAAYAACNVPAIFLADPAVQAVAVCLALAGGLALAPRQARDAVGAGPLGPGPGVGPAPWPSAGRPWWSAHGGAGWALPAAVVGLGALVFLDSAAFAVVQATPALREATWGSPERIAAIGAVHLGGALVAATLHARRGRLPVLALTVLAFAVALGSLAAGEAGPREAWLYAFGISLYSVALVLEPAAAAGSPGVSARAPGAAGPQPALAVARRAGWLFGLAGWVASAAGVGMAQDLRRLPPAAVAVALALALGALAVAAGRAAPTTRLLAGLAAVFAIAGWLPSRPSPIDAPVAPIPAALEKGERRAAGRAVYVAEGCLHCHSQFPRAAGRDAPWGPPRPLDRSDRPPLVGNRRQGPDLARVGVRRSREWNRAHLRDPRALVPGSRMPSYAHLFAARPGVGGPGTDGEDVSPGARLLDYLDALGVDPAAAGTDGSPRGPAPGAPEPAPLSPGGGSSAAGAALFGRWCAGCHGAAGEGRPAPRVEAAGIAARPSMNLRKGPPWLLDRTAPLESSLARAVRFGIPGTSMPGHEALTAAEVSHLVAFLQAGPMASAQAAGSGRAD